MQVDGSPTPLSVTCGVAGLMAGPFRISRSWIIEWGLFALRLGVATPDLRTRWRDICKLSTSSHSLALGRPPLLAVRLPVRRVSPLNSQVALILHGSAAVCRIATRADGFHGSCLEHVAIPALTPVLSRLSADFLRTAVTSQFLVHTALMT